LQDTYVNLLILKVFKNLMAGAYAHLKNGATSLTSFFFILINLKRKWVLKQEIKICYA